MTVEVQEGDVVWLGEAAPPWARGMLMFVTEVKSWGLKGEVPGHHDVLYPVRVTHEAVLEIYRSTVELPRD